MIKIKFKTLSIILVLSLIGFKAHSDDYVDSLRINEKDIESGEQNKKLVATEVLVTESEEKALSHIKNLIKKYKGTTMEANLIFRLAELYMSRAKSARFIEQIKDEQGVLSFLPPQVKTLKEKSMVLNAIKSYLEIEKRFPKYGEMDQVIFNRAFAHLQINQKDYAEKAFVKLLKTKKRSQLRPDAFLAVGEINFEKLNFKRALAYYSQVKKYKRARVYPYSLYKGSWCYFNLRGYEQAIKELEKVIAFGKMVEKNEQDARLDLRNEALVDMALFYSTIRDGADAVNYFVQLAGNKDPVPSLRRLAVIYNRHGKDVKQQSVLLGLIKLFKAHNDVPHFYKELARNFDRQNKFQNSAKALWSFSKSCKKVTQREKELTEDFCMTEVYRLSKNLAVKWLKAYELNKKNADANKRNMLMAIVAESAFRVHLYEREPTDEDSKMRFYFAEHIFELDKALEASLEYDKVGDSTKDKERKHKARYAAMYSYDKHYNSEYKGKESDRFRELSNKYMKDFPEGEEYLNVAFKLALFDYKTKNYEQAMPLLLSLGEKFFLEEKGKKSQDLYLDILNSKKDFVEIQKYAKIWKQKEPDIKRSADLQKLFEQAFFSEAQNLEDEKKYETALNRYTDFIDNNADSNFVDEARWNKISMHFKLKQYDKTAESYISFFRLHPKNENAQPGLLKAVEIYEMMAEPEKAVGVTEILTKVDVKNSEKWEYLTASYLMSSGQYELAAKRFYSLIFKSKDFKDASIDGFFSVSNNLDQSAWYISSIDNLVKSPSRDLASQAIRVKLDYLEIQGNKSNLLQFARSQRKNPKLKSSQKGLLFLYDAQEKEKNFNKTTISSKSMDTIVAGIQSKTKSLDYVQSLYQSALNDEDQNVVVESLIGLSRIYDSFVKDLKNLRAPASFGEEEADMLKQEISNIIMPFEEKSAEALGQATTVAEKSEFRNGTLGKARDLFDVVNFDVKYLSNIKVDLPEPIGPRGI